MMIVADEAVLKREPAEALMENVINEINDLYALLQKPCNSA